MEKKASAILLSVVMTFAAMFVFGGCGENVDEDYFAVELMSEAGSRLYSLTKKGMEELASIDVSSLDNQEFIDANYIVSCYDNGISFSYSFVDDLNFSTARISRNSAHIQIDKSYADLSPDKVREKYFALVAQGLVTIQQLNDIAESGHLENILYSYKITYVEYHHIRTSIEAFVFKNPEKLQAAADSGLFITGGFIPFFDEYSYYENVLIVYEPYYDPEIVNAEMVEPTVQEINKIKFAIKTATATIKVLIKENNGK